MRHVPLGLFRLCLAAVLVGSLGVCDTTVRPIDAQGQYFSVFGLLNPTRDTQFVRVEPLGDSIQVGAAPQIDATVTLTHTKTGRTIVLKDSAARFPITGPLGEDVALVHNFWATATLPSHSPEVDTIRTPLRGDNVYVPATVRVPIDYLIEATVVYVDASGPRRIDYTEVATRRDGSYRLRIPPPCGAKENVFELIVYAGGPSWPRLPNVGNVSAEALLALDTLSNVHRGVGFFGGAYSSRTEIPIRRLNP